MRSSRYARFEQRERSVLSEREKDKHAVTIGESFWMLGILYLCVALHPLCVGSHLCDKKYSGWYTPALTDLRDNQIVFLD